VFQDGEIELLNQVGQRHWEAQGFDQEPPEKGQRKISSTRHYVMKHARKK
jgi:hypothetical protein